MICLINNLNPIVKIFCVKKKESYNSLGLQCLVKFDILKQAHRTQFCFKKGKEFQKEIN